MNSYFFRCSEDAIGDVAVIGTNRIADTGVGNAFQDEIIGIVQLGDFISVSREGEIDAVPEVLNRIGVISCYQVNTSVRHIAGVEEQGLSGFAQHGGLDDLEQQIGSVLS